MFQTCFKALGCQAEIQLFAENQSQADKIFNLAKDEIARIEKKYSRYIPDSIISKINNNSSLQPVQVDDETAGLIDYAAACYQQSNGLFDITSGVLRKAWNFYSNQPPTQSQIDELLPLVGWPKVIWNKPEIYLPHKGMELDFGGFGKEYAVDRVIKVIVDEGIESACINLGGDIRITGPMNHDKPWSIGLKHPRNNDAIGGILIKSGAIATSGDYERFMIVDGKRYCHILNPMTGWPANSIQSVTVIADSCLIAGSASTIAFLKPLNEALDFLNALEVQYLIVDIDGGIIKSICRA
jgi:FAD:protein FMN transferase